MYALGIDLGTTYTAAATWREGRAQIVSLGGRGAAIPSVVLLREDETFLTGEAANRRGLTSPGRLAREFKRRLGDTTPLMLGGTPYSAEALTAQLLRAVVSEVSTREGGPPASVCVSHPANWGPYKIDLLRQAIRMADLPSATFVTEPEAAAVNYAAEQRLGVGAVVAVYDLGGGTFDAAVLRRTPGGFTILGEPEGIERLGGIDFDAAVFNHVRTTLGSKLDDLDEDDPAVITAVARLREECVQAKEALSADTDTSIPVLLPSVTTEVRLTRGELESMVRPALHGSIEALRRAVRSAGLTPEQLHSVLLVGGSSRMPLVGQLVTADLGRPVAVDTHPKHAVALGAARLAGGGFGAPAGQAGPGGQAGGPGALGGIAGLGAVAGLGGAALAGGHGGARGAAGAAGARTAGQPNGFNGGAAGQTGPGGAGGGLGGGSAGLASSAGSASGAGGYTGPGGAAGSASGAGGYTGPGGAAGSAAGSGTGPTRPGDTARPGGNASGYGGGPAGPGDTPGSTASPTRPGDSARPGANTGGRGGLAGPGDAGRPAAGLGSGAPSGGETDRSARFGAAGPAGFGGQAGRGTATNRPEGTGGPGSRAGTGPGGTRAGRGPGAAGPGGGSRTTSRLAADGEPGSRTRERGGSTAPPRSGEQVAPPASADRRRRVLVLAAGVVALVLLAGAGVGLAVLGGDDNPSGSGGPSSTRAASPLPADEQCTDAIMSNPRWVCLTSAIVADGKITIDYRGDGAAMTIDGGYHLHVYGGDGVNPPADVMGMHAPAAEQGKWYVEDRHPAVLALDDERFRTAIGDAPKVCARVADANHRLVPDAKGAYVTGNCVPITRTAAPDTTVEPEPTTRNRPPTKKTTTTATTTTTESSPDPTTTTTEPEILTKSPAP